MSCVFPERTLLDLNQNVVVASIQTNLKSAGNIWRTSILIMWNDNEIVAHLSADDIQTLINILQMNGFYQHEHHFLPSWEAQTWAFSAEEAVEYSSLYAQELCVQLASQDDFDNFSLEGSCSFASVTASFFLSKSFCNLIHICLHLFCIQEVFDIRCSFHPESFA